LGLGPDGQAACGFLAAVGHSWTPFLRFQGGKAVATSLGAFLAMEPTGALFAVAVATAVFLATGYFSAASLSGTLVGMAWMVVAAVLGRVPVVYAAFGLALAGLIFFRHISNLRRILAGTERRVRWPWSQSA
jgi:glycerol-3-phosphate acyltransferase PlsY